MQSFVHRSTPWRWQLCGILRDQRPLDGTVCASETSINFCENWQHSISEGSDLHTRLCKNLICLKLKGKLEVCLQEVSQYTDSDPKSASLNNMPSSIKARKSHMTLIRDESRLVLFVLHLMYRVCAGLHRDRAYVINHRRVTKCY